MLKLYYEGTEMSGYANVSECIHRENGPGRADCLEVTFDHAAAWTRWRPQMDDALWAEADGYSTGRMYLNSIRPEGDRYRIVASSLPSAARRRAWQSYQGATFTSLLHRCAVECGMGEGSYGLEGDYRYPFLLRRDEGCAAFLARICQWEGMALRAVNGALRAIDVNWAQRRAAALDLQIDTDQDGAAHTVQRPLMMSALTVTGRGGVSAVARDAAGAGGHQRTIALPATDAVQCGRWARGMLLMENRQAERLEMRTVFNPAMTAMIRVNVRGDTAATGSWLVDSVEHDLTQEYTASILTRCVEIQ